MMTVVACWLGALGMVSGEEINGHLYPSKTNSIVVIDFDAIRASGLFAEQMAEDFESFLQDNEHFRKLNEMLGVNLADETTRITICGQSIGPPGPPGTGGPEGGRGGGDVLSISNGSFSYEKISKVLEEMAERGELTKFTVNDLPIYFNHRSREAIYFGIVDDGVMISSSRKGIIEDAIQGLTDLREPDKVLMDRLQWSSEDTKEEKIKPAVYLAGVFPEQARAALERSPLKEIAKDMVGYNLTIHLGEKAFFRGRLELASDESATRAEKMFNLFTGLMKTSIKNQGSRPDMLELFGNMEIKADKKDLKFNMTAPRTLLAQVSENDRKDPNSPRNRMKKMREERRKKEAAGENVSETKEDDEEKENAQEKEKADPDSGKEQAASEEKSEG
ncbi:hypothetical protein K2X85_12700 [bacterium]|nr:hypothetical protein [bacterium]